MAVPAGASWSVDVAFQPTQAGPCSGVLTIVDDGPGEPRSVLLSGTGK